MLKIILFVALGVLWTLFLVAAYTGRRTARGNVMRLVPRHRRKGRVLLYVLVGLVIIIELLVRGGTSANSHDLLFWIHVTLSVAFFVCILLMNSVFNGRRSNNLHRWFAYSSLAILIGVTATAIPIILRLPD